MRRPGPARARALALVACLAAGSAGLPGRARAEGVPARNQALLLLRVLAYDRNLRDRAPSAVTVAVLYRLGDRASEERRDELLGAFEQAAREAVVRGLPVKVHALAYKDPADLDARLGELRATLLYVDPALAAAVPEIAPAARHRAVLTADGSRALVEAGVAVAVVARASQARVVVNLRAFKEAGADLDAALLAVSDVVRN